MDRILYSKFAIYHSQDSDLDTAPDLEFPLVLGSRFRAVNTGIDEPASRGVTS